MIQIIFIIFGVYVLIKGEVKISSKRKIKKPKSIYFGIVLIALPLLTSFVSDVFGIFIYAVLILAIVAFSFLGEKVPVLPENKNQ